VVSYDPAFRLRDRYIVESGLAPDVRREPENVYFYMTIYNEPYVQPAEPEGLDVEALLRGIYRYRPAPRKRPTFRCRFLASGVACQRPCARPSCLPGMVMAATSGSVTNGRAAACADERTAHPIATPVASVLRHRPDVGGHIPFLGKQLGRAHGLWHATPRRGSARRGSVSRGPARYR